MNEVATLAVVVLLGLIQTLGLGAAALARLSEGSPHEQASQRLFLACLALVGISALVGLFLGPAFWLTSGATLSLMIVAATCDFNHTQRAAEV
jgi:hypothetical protein